MNIISYKNGHKDRIIEESIKTLGNGGLIIAPSDTVYGLLADATNKKAVSKLIDFKSRPPGKAISTFMPSLTFAQQYVQISSQNRKLLKEFIPGPFTIVLPSKHKVDNRLESENGSLGIRIINFDMIIEIVRKLGRPITATSANISSTSPHYSISSLLNSLSKSKLKLIDLVIDFGKLKKNKPSTVIDLIGDRIEILRRGDMIMLTRSGEKTHYISTSELQTKQIAYDMINSVKDKLSKKPLVIILQGQLGVGKTIFTKGIGEFFGVSSIVSPSFVICSEYVIQSGGINYLHHCDFYRIQDNHEFKFLGLEKMLIKNNIIVIEWGEKSKKLIDSFKQKSTIIYVTLEYKTEKERAITIYQ